MSEKVIKYAFYLAPQCKPNREALPSVSLVSLCVLRASVRRLLVQGHSWDPVERGGSRGAGGVPVATLLQRERHSRTSAKASRVPPAPRESGTHGGLGEAGGGLGGGRRGWMVAVLKTFGKS